jgi:hypothetical protein
MLARNLWHKSITDDAVLDACERHAMTLDNPGFCLMCGLEAFGVEPDAENYKCESCGAEQVFGADQLLIEIA